MMMMMEDPQIGDVEFDAIPNTAYTNMSTIVRMYLI